MRLSPANLQRIRNELRRQFTGEEARILRAMTPQKRLEVAFGLYRTVYQLKAAYLRKIHPDWSEQKIDSYMRELFLYGYVDMKE